MNRNTIKKAKKVKEIVDQYYCPASHRDCMRYIFRTKVVQVYPMCESTFYRLIGIAIGIDGYLGNGSNRIQRPKKHIEQYNNPKEPTLFDNYDTGTI